MIHEFDPDMLPDDAFVPGSLEHLVPGNRGRLLDPRRTPVSVVEIRPVTGEFVVEIAGFEDRGARWVVPFEEVEHYQFDPDGARARAEDVTAWREAVARFDRPLAVPRDEERRPETLAEIEERERAARRWLGTSSRFFGSGRELSPARDDRRGEPELATDLGSFLGERGLAGMETAFAEQYVSNPYSGERIKGHRIVLAELGLVALEDKAIRDPDLFAGEWSRARREDHVLWRLAFLRAVFRTAGLETVTLYRGMAVDGAPRPPRNQTFVSASFSFEVARSLFEPRNPGTNGVLLRQEVPVDRLFMTYLETEAMNRQFLEAEAVLLFEEGNPLF
jgi:hypothetical protein